MIPAVKLQDMMEKHIIQIAPLAFMRGRTLSDAVVILDEAQNTTSQQIRMFLTRMGMNTEDDYHRRPDNRLTCHANSEAD